MANLPIGRILGVGAAVAATAAGVVAAAKIIGGRNDAPELVDAATLASDDSEFIELDGLQIHVIRRGSPTSDAIPIIFIHGVLASVFTWRPVLDKLAATRRSLAFDRPAFGLSGRPRRDELSDELWKKDGSPYSMQRSESVLFSLIDHLGAEQAILVGHSQGGAVAASAAARHPERVAALVLEAPALSMPIPNLALAFAAGVPTAAGIRLARRVADLDDKNFGFVWHSLDKVTPETVEGYRLPTKIERWDEALWEHIRSFRVPSFDTDQLERIAGIPTLVITGDHDRVVPTAGTHVFVDRLRAAGSTARLEVVGDCGHVVHEEETALFVDLLTEFISDHDL